MSCRHFVEHGVDGDNSTLSAIAASTEPIRGPQGARLKEEFPWKLRVVAEDDEITMAGNLLGYGRASR